MSKKNNIDNVVLLYDSYKETLTKKQRTLFEYYYFDDMSLKEIAEKNKITRSAVHDSIHKTVDALNKVEKQLKLSEKTEILNSLKKELTKDKPSLNKIKKLLK